jgi:hypothetical protein
MIQADDIINFRPQKSLFSREEKWRLDNLVEAYASQNGLGAALSALWQQQKAIGFILGNPSVSENLNPDESGKFLSINIGPYWLIHSPARKDRRNVPFLIEHGILAQHPRFVYEKLEGDRYEHYPGKKHGFKRECFLCSANEANPNEVLVSLYHGGTEFIYGANFATLGYCHFTVWTRVPILQRYWPQDTLFWLLEHGRRLASDKYTTFFNSLGAGNSANHFHYQTLREDFPIFKAPVIRELPNTGIARLEWPIPAYRVITTPGQSLSDELAQMDQFISKWCTMHTDNTLNLIHKTDSNGNAYLIFVPRVNRNGKRRPPQISNDFAGCEVSGRINIDNPDEWKWASEKPESAITEMLRLLSPPQEQIAALEATLAGSF